MIHSIGFVPVAVLASILTCTQPVRGQERHLYREEWAIDDLDGAQVRMTRSLSVTSSCILWAVVPSRGIARFDCEGRELSSIGQPGDAPGEFLFPFRVERLEGDTILAYDARLNRASVFDQEGRFIAATQLPDLVTRHGDVRAINRLGDDLLWWTVDKPRTPPRPREHRSYVWSFDEASGRVDSVLAFAGPDYVISRDNVNTVAVEAPFGSKPIVTLGDAVIIVGNTRSHEISVYTDVRGLPRTVSLRTDAPATVRSVDIKDSESRIRNQLFIELDRMRFGPEMREYFTDKFNGLLLNLRFPSEGRVFELFVKGPAEELWALRPCVAAVDMCRWDVFDYRSGERLRTVMVDHKAPVVAAVVRGAALFTMEVSSEEIGRVAKYAPR
jgi:hypothetical protein